MGGSAKGCGVGELRCDAADVGLNKWIKNGKLFVVMVEWRWWCWFGIGVDVGPTEGTSWSQKMRGKDVSHVTIKVLVEIRNIYICLWIKSNALDVHGHDGNIKSSLFWRIGHNDNEDSSCEK